MDPVELEYPFTGRWRVLNSPADRVPSHGTDRFASSYAIDFVPVDDSVRSAPRTLESWLRPERPERFPGFGRPVLAPLPGVVRAMENGSADHPAYRGFPSVAYALTQDRRAAGVWTNVAGNHVLIERQDGAVVVLCHLQHGSVRVRPGQRVETGEAIARCGNSGNSTEPHLHLQAIDRVDVEQAHALPITFGGTFPRNGEIVTINE